MALGDFCRETDQLFHRRIERFEVRIAKQLRKPHDEVDEMFWSDSHLELLQQRDLGAYFGVLMVFSALERYLQRLYEDAIYVATIPEFRDVAFEVSPKWLALDQMKRFVNRLGVADVEAVCDWKGIEKLRRLRNAIAHQGGEVTDSNVKFLKPYGYNTGQSVAISFDYVKESTKLVEAAAKSLGRAYLEAINRRRPGIG